PSIKPVISEYSTALSANSSVYDRFGGFRMYYYEAIMISVPETGNYGILSESSMDTYGYLYLNHFNPLNIEENLIAGDNDKGDNLQFGIGYNFKSTKKYILVVTTKDPLVVGPLSILAVGPKAVTFTPMENISTTTQSVSTTSPELCE
ncbi:unnamed protein product, partial [Rotaria sp. Silwood2]